jgi:hypothetical protein
MKFRTRAIGVLAVVAVPAAFFGAQAVAGSGTPANKVVAAGSKRVVVAAGQTETIMSGTMRTSKPTDIMIHAGLECSIFTQLLTNNTDNSATAGARARVWVEVDGKIVSLTQNSMPPQNDTVPSSGNDTDKVTFCDREYSRTVTDQEDPLDGIDSQDDYIRTKAAHGFNWVRMNMGSGIHKIEVKAELTTNTTGQATAELEIGNRTLIIEPTKMANDAVIQEAGSY